MYGFYRDGVTKATYNHYDSYPDYLGESIVKFVRETSVGELNEIFDRIIMVEEDSKPTVEQINESIIYYDDRVSTGQIDEWYALLRHSQGDLAVYKKGLRYMIDNSGFINDSSCQWAYLVNLDEHMLEVYQGFQDEPLIEFTLDHIPSNWVALVENLAS